MATVVDEIQTTRIQPGETVTGSAEGRTARVTLMSDGFYRGFISEVQDGKVHTFSVSGPLTYVVRALRIVNRQRHIR